MKPQEQLMRAAAVLVSVFCMAAMFIMVRFASAKTVVIAEDITAGTALGSENAPDGGRKLQLSTQGTETGALKIPVSKEVRPDDIVIENRYIDYVINIFITGSEAGFYAGQEINGNLNSVEEAVYYEEKDVTRLQLKLDGFYEHKYLFENNVLYLEFVQPRDMYDKIVVIDAAHGGEDSGWKTRGFSEKDLTLDIAMRLREKLETAGIKAYYTRVEDVNPSEEARAMLANRSKADMFISIHGNADEENENTYGTTARYNPDYVIPYFGNIELADCLERQVVTKIDGRANGLAPAGEKEELLNQITVPAAVLEVGYLTNEQELSLLKQDEYREQIAAGIFDAITASYETEKE